MAAQGVGRGGPQPLSVGDALLYLDQVSTIMILSSNSCNATIHSFHMAVKARGAEWNQVLWDRFRSS